MVAAGPRTPGRSRRRRHLPNLASQEPAVNETDTVEPGEEEAAQPPGVRTMLTSVHAVRELGPRLRQVTFRGGDLGGFRPLGPDTFVYVLLPPPGRADLTVDRHFTWVAYHELPPEDRPVGAYYTVRRWRPEQAELDAWFVLHGDEGPASAWALAARPGDPVALWGPRSAWSPPPTTSHHLIVADETGLPAAAAILEHLPPGIPVVVVAETAGADHRAHLPSRHGVEVRWVDRGGAAPGTTTLLVETVATLDLEVDGLYAYGGAESRAVTAVRELLRRERGCSRAQVSMVGYWRHADSPPGDDE